MTSLVGLSAHERFSRFSLKWKSKKELHFKILLWGHMAILTYLLNPEALYKNF